MITRLLPVLVVAFALCAPLAAAAERGRGGAVDLAARTAQVEALRARLAVAPSPTASGTLIESENLLQQLRTAPADKRAALLGQLDAILARLELEIAAPGR